MPVPPSGEVPQEKGARRWPRKGYISESYAVKEKYVHRIKTLWGIEPEVDGFATADNRRFSEWWGHGSPYGEDAFGQHWGSERLLWLNPPFSHLGQVVEKLARDESHAVLVVPDWARSKWYKRAMKMSVAELVFPKGTKFFELRGEPLKGTLWGVKVMLICGHRQRCCDLKSPTCPDTLLIPRPKGKVRFNLKNTQVLLHPPHRLLDLFSGTGSVGEVYRREGYEVVSVDNDPGWKPTHTVDVLLWEYRAAYPPGYFHTIVCAPPCTEYSRAKTTAPRDLSKADPLVQKALEIVEYFEPQRWWMENPRYGLLPTREFMQGLPFVDVDYCQYSNWGYQKPTRIWGSEEVVRVRGRTCDGITCPNLVEPTQDPPEKRRHRVKLSSPHESVPTYQKYRIPEQLVRELGGLRRRGKKKGEEELKSGRGRESSPPPPQVPEPPGPLEVGPWLLEPAEAYPIGEVRARDQEHRQVLVHVRAKGSDGPWTILAALVDTGAEVNLIRKGAVSAHLFRPAERPLTLLTADGSRMDGGQREVTLRLCLGTTRPNKEGKEEWCTRATFHEADIQVDLILSCPWLARQQLGVFPHMKGLVKLEEHDPLMLLTSWPTKGERSPVKGTPPAQGICTLREETPRQEPLAWVAKVRAMNLAVPAEAAEEEEDPLYEDEEALEYVASQMMKWEGEGDELRDPPGPPARVGSLILVPEEGEAPSEEEKLVRELVEGIERDYGGAVLREDVPPENIIPRGPHGEGRIVIKPGCQARKIRPIHLTGERREALIELVREWVKGGKVEDGQGEWSSPAFVVAKKGGKWRGVVDFRALNEATVTDAHPLPRIEDMLVNFGRKAIFTVMDLKDAFHQVPLHRDSRPYTCTSTPIGTKQWCVVVMGLKNGVAMFQRVVEYCLDPVTDVAAPYVDDILTGSDGQPTVQESLRAHDRDLRRVLEALKANKLVADSKKCKFFVREVEFCGHILGGGARRPAPGKLMALEKWEEPRTVTALRGFLGFTNYYSTYVENYSAIVAELLDLLKLNRVEGRKGSKKPVRFTEAQRKAFETIKERLVSGLKLYTANPDKPFVLRVDASDRAVGAALEQFADNQQGKPTLADIPTRRRVPVAFCSRKLTPGQAQRWPPREKETYAIVLALEKWASWIGLQPVLVLTDHKSLESWATETLDTPSGPAGRRGRWHERLSRFDIEVAYIAGKDNVVADALSRWAYPASKAFADTSIHGSDQDAEEMEALIQEERREERQCQVLFVRDIMARLLDHARVRVASVGRELCEGEGDQSPGLAKLRTIVGGVTTRSGAATGRDEAEFPPSSQPAAPLSQVSPPSGGQSVDSPDNPPETGKGKEKTPAVAPEADRPLGRPSSDPAVEDEDDDIVELTTPKSGEGKGREGSGGRVGEVHPPTPKLRAPRKVRIQGVGLVVWKTPLGEEPWQRTPTQTQGTQSPQRWGL